MTRVSYLGPPASFSHQAALKTFSLEPEAKLHPAESFSDIFAAVQGQVSNFGPDSNTEAEYGVIPFENSTNGSVVQVLDLLVDHGDKYPDVEVCAEFYLSVHHCLLVFNDDQTDGVGLDASLQRISKIYTHPQVWGQCGGFLSRHLKGVERIDVGSTSLAARNVREENSRGGAAIASRLAGETHGLSVLAEDIEDDGNNTTRFLVLRKRTSVNVRESGTQGSPETEMQSVLDIKTEDAGQGASMKWKSLIKFSIAHTAPGSLASALAVFKQYAFNLTSIDTRPSRQQPWHYVFFVECEETRTRDEVEKLQRMLAELAEHTETCKHLGCWREQSGGIGDR